MKTTFLSLALTLFGFITSHAQVQTIVVPSGTNSGQTLNIPANSYAKLLSLMGANVGINISAQGVSTTIANNNGAGIPWNNSEPVVVTGPATIQIGNYPLQGQPGFPYPGLATFDVEPAPFPPNKTAIIAANSGNVQVTMQTSTDLVNWTAAVNEQVYTNVPDARFFRIQIQTGVSP